METRNLMCGEVKAVDSADPNGEFEVVLSAPTLDRDGEVIDEKAFDPLPDHITFDIDHGLSTASTVGSGTPRYEDGLLKVTGTFSSIPRAQEVRTLVTEGHIRTTSVAFMDAKRETKDGVAHVTHAELLNGAFVPVPSNRQALIVAAKAGARNSRNDSETIQSLHDHAVSLGAVCAKSEETASAEPDNSKSPVIAPEDEADQTVPASLPAAGVWTSRADLANAELWLIESADTPSEGEPPQ